MPEQISIKPVLLSVRRKKPLFFVLAIVLLFLALACGESDKRTRLEPPGDDISKMACLILMEKTELLIQKYGAMGLTPIPDSISLYFGRLEPYGFPLRFELEGSGNVYLAWIPMEKLSGKQEKVKIILGRHVIQNFEGSRESFGFEIDPLILEAEIAPGRATFLGEAVRRIEYIQSDDGELAPRVYVEAPMSVNPEALQGLMLDNSWLADRLIKTGP